MRTCGFFLDECGMKDQDLLKGCCEHPHKGNALPNKQQKAVWREITMPIFPNIVYKCLFTFKGGYDIDMNNLHW